MPGFDRTTLGMMAMFTLGATACSAERATVTTGSNSGAGGTAATHGSGAGPASSSAIVAGSAGVGAGGAGGGPAVCDPPAAAGSLYAQNGDAFGALDPISMCQYRGEVLLIVNTAAL